MKKTGFLIALILLFPGSSHATEVELQISKQAGKKMDVALAPPQNTLRNQTALPNSFQETLSFDLDQSGYFDLVKAPSEVQAISKSEALDSISETARWRSLGAEIVVKTAYVVNGPTGTMDLYAFEVQDQKRIFGKRYKFNSSTLNLLAHTCANDLIYHLTGEQGIAGTEIAFVAGNLKSKEVFICDTDGKNVRQLTQDHHIVLGVSWHPQKRKLIYTSFKDGQPHIYLHDLDRGTRENISHYPGLNAAAKFSPDGQHIAMVLSKDGNPEIYLTDLHGENLKRLTNHPSVDASPCWSPDGRKIAFMSDRSGHPHLYLLDLRGEILKRLTHQGTYNASPSWSPKGDKIAFSSDMAGGFKICVLDLKDETITIVSQEGGEAEEPDWAPDGEHIVYSSRVGEIYQIFIVNILDGKTTRLSSGQMSCLTPTWSY
ncbi:MAG: Tol-Pal system beta propeller repeat protein TolB [Chlamydiae bacterium]|nr:Tol-Pal system beta propeller repeat protein TolB [Chlamydiota bacterium]MBI3277943.1 Tol-Pal system beta propeller repeat protein TolB [Chlamydiota bacterium]